MAAFGGRALATLPFDGRLLGADFARVRPPASEFMVLGGMMVSRADIPALLAPLRSVANLRHVAGLLVRHGRDRLRFRRGTRLVMGNALAARLLYSLRQAKVPIRFDTGLIGLIRDGHRVVGATVMGPNGRRTIRAERGVILATGGLARDPALRAELFPEPARSLSLAPASHTGDAVRAALAEGAALDGAMESAGLWMPCSVLTRADGTQSVWPHIILDRAKPGLIAVNAAGRRFCNEADSYHDVCMAMLRADAASPSIPAHLVVDRRFIADYGLGLVHPGTRNLSRFIRAGYLIEAPDLRGLAGKMGADPDGLEATVAAHNDDARAGVDRAFGRGDSDLNRINGDPANRPNPCLRPIGPGPFYAVAIRPADLASSAGLAGDADGRVLDAAGGADPGFIRLRQRSRFHLPRHLSRPRHHHWPGHGLRLARSAACRRAVRRPRIHTAGGARMTAFSTAIQGHGAIVTGGARGFGLGIARRLAAAACRVALWDRSFDAFDATVAGFDPALRQMVDVTDSAAVTTAFAEAAAELGQVHILVNNAGITGPVGPSWDYALEDWRRVLDIDLDGVFHGCRAAIPHMRGHGYGRIVNIASIAGKEGNANGAAYAAAKGGCDCFQQIGGQGTGGQRRAGELRRSGDGADRVAERDGARIHRSDEGQDPDEPFPPGRGSGGDGGLDRQPGLQLHHRFHFRPDRRQGDLLMRPRAVPLFRVRSGEPHGRADGPGALH